MSNIDILTPMEAACIATNCYFTLKDWITAKPTAGVESRANVQTQVLGAGNAGSPRAGPNTSLKGSALGGGTLTDIFSGTTGLGTRSGFGYVLKCKRDGVRHTIIATRGTRPELGLPDLLTDFRGSMTGFGDYGPVHKGFKTTYDSVIAALGREHDLASDADVVHCVGHSLGGAVATLLAAQFARSGKPVRLYTFGSPRVGAFGAYAALQEGIGKDNILRVAHDLDPISLIGPFPYVHVNPYPSDPNNMTVPSPTGALLSTRNHDMAMYIDSTVRRTGNNWDNLRNFARKTDYDNCALVKALLHPDRHPNWVQRASAKTLGLLFKLFSHVLAAQSVSLILSLSALDLLAEMTMKGLYRVAALGEQVFELMRSAAEWAGVPLRAGADFTVEVIRAILEAMLAALKTLASAALSNPTIGLVPVPLLLGASWVLTGAGAF